MRWLLAVAILAISCGPKPVTVTPAPSNYVIMPDIPDDDRICVVLPPAGGRDPAHVGVHCTDIGTLRFWLSRHLKANDQ